MEPLAADMAREVGTRLRNYRRRLGLTQEKVCSFLSMTPVSLSLLENGKKTPSLLALGRLAELYGVRYDELIPQIHEDRLDGAIPENGTLREQIEAMVEVARWRGHYEMSYYGRERRIEVFQQSIDIVTILVTDETGLFEKREISRRDLDILGSNGIYGAIKALGKKVWWKKRDRR